MHPELVAISNVWQRDASIDAARAEHDGLTAAVAQARSAVGAARAELTTREAEHERLRKEERTNARSLDEYVQKRDNNRRMIDTGTAGDYAAAERQLERCLTLIDELETKGLTLLDELDAAHAQVERARRELTLAERALLEARERLGARDAAIRAEITANAQAREAAWAELPVEYRTPYQELRRRKRRVLVNVVEGNCVQCHMRVPPQRMVEVQLARFVHTCPGCQGYLLP